MVIEDKTLNVCVCVHAQSCPTLCDTLDGSLPGSFVHGIFPGKSTGVSCHFLLQGIFLIQGSNLCLLNWQADYPPLCHLGAHFSITLFKIEIMEIISCQPCAKYHVDRYVCAGSVAQLCLTLCHPMDCGPPGSSLWDSLGKNTRVVAIFSSRGFSQPRDHMCVSCIFYFGRQILYY